MVSVFSSVAIILSLGPEFSHAQCCLDIGGAVSAVLALGAVGSLLKHGHHGHHFGLHGLKGHKHGHGHGHHDSGHHDDHHSLVQEYADDEPQHYRYLKKKKY